jgi:hypothetical protein
VLLALRFVASLIVSLWGLVMVVLGIVQGSLLWIPLGLAVLVVGLPLLASNPLATSRLYPTVATQPESRGVGS